MSSDPALLWNIGIALSWTGLLWIFARFLTRGVPCLASPSVCAVVAAVSSGAVFSILHAHPDFYLAYFFFFSALIVTMFTDVTTLLISQFVTLYAVPLGWMLSNLQLLPVSPLASIGGSLFGLLLMCAVRTLSRKALGKEGMGQGDVDLLCFIGSFTGPIGCWATLTIGSILASFAGLFYVVVTRGRRDVLLPFGLFLAVAAMLFVTFQAQLMALFWPF